MQVLVLDHESADATAAIARANGAHVITRPFEGFLRARQFALAQVNTPWTLMIDADEALDGTLHDAVLSASDDADAYILSRTTYYRGKPLRMWRGERLLRLFRTNRVRLEAAPAAGGEALAGETAGHWQAAGRLGEELTARVAAAAAAERVFGYAEAGGHWAAKPGISSFTTWAAG